MQGVLCPGLETPKKKGHGTFYSDSRGGHEDASLFWRHARRAGVVQLKKAPGRP